MVRGQDLPKCRGIIAVYLDDAYFFGFSLSLQISQKLEQTDAPSGLKEDMHNVKELFDNMKRSAWN